MRQSPISPDTNTVYFDLETQKSAAEVGGWANIRRMRLAVGVTYSTATRQYETFLEDAAGALVEELSGADVVVGFNVKRFDYTVLSPYTSVRLWQLPTFDMLEHVTRTLGFRLSLEALARATLNEAKSADGMQSLRWWKSGRVDLIVEYCRKDVEITRRLHEYAREHGYLLYFSRDGHKRRVNTQHW
ncbi:MAG: ribonuclease H-like domain-containing protein [Candidatus Poribacteria bacterium]|nr:ribonuclease H-like domain-containing protein [Candidatus Poribacteria bacterium]